MMNIKNIVILMLIAMCTSISLSALSQPRTYKFEAVDTLLNTKPRPVVVYIYTDWCKYCGAMKNSTLKNDRVIHKLGSQFYFVMLNAEEQSDIHFGGKSFSFTPTGAGTGTHDLATTLSKNNSGYPLICILNDKRQVVFQHSGFLKAAELYAMLDAAGPKQQTNHEPAN